MLMSSMNATSSSGECAAEPLVFRDLDRHRLVSSQTLQHRQKREVDLRCGEKLFDELLGNRFPSKPIMMEAKPPMPYSLARSACCCCASTRRRS